MANGKRTSTYLRALVTGAVLVAILAGPSAASAAFTLTATAGDGRVSLNWPDVMTSGGFYDVYRDGVWVKYLDAPTSAWTNTGLTNGRTYRYQVLAYRWGTGSNTLVDSSAYATATPPGIGFGCVKLSSLAPGARPPGCWRPFADNSPFNHRISAAPTLHANSASIVAYMMTGGPPAKLASNTGGYDWGHANYFAKATDPLYTIHCREPWGTCEPEGKQYRIPAPAKPAGYLMKNPDGSLLNVGDRHISAVQPDGVTTLDLWQSDIPSGRGGTLNASWGGVSKINGTGLESNAGSTAAMFGGFAGQIRAEEMKAGKINHALFAAVPCTRGYIYPARKGASECPASVTNAPPNGARLQLNMTAAEISALPVPQWKKVILNALRQYGMIIGDTGGGNSMFGLQFESGMVDRSFGRAEAMDQYAIAQGVVPWSDPAWYGGRPVHIFDLAPGVNWAGKLRVLAPCVSNGTC